MEHMLLRTIFIFFVISLLTVFCITREARQLKRETEGWRESPVVLEAYADSPLSGTFLILRENKKFEKTSSGLFKSFEAGMWSKSQDTLEDLVN